MANFEFKNRKTNTPARIKLRNVVTNAEETYDVILDENVVEEGTPLNAQTFNAFKEDILQSVARLDITEEMKGEKGRQRR